MHEFKEKIPELLERFKFPLLILAVGILLLIIPAGNDVSVSLSGNDALISEMLSNVHGVGETMVLISDKGVVVVCPGADDARVRMEIIQAIRSYTGYGSDKITILKMVD